MDFWNESRVNVGNGMLATMVFARRPPMTCFYFAEPADGQGNIANTSLENQTLDWGSPSIRNGRSLKQIK